MKKTKIHNTVAMKMVMRSKTKMEAKRRQLKRCGSWSLEIGFSNGSASYRIKYQVLQMSVLKSKLRFSSVRIKRSASCHRVPYGTMISSQDSRVIKTYKRAKKSKRELRIEIPKALKSNKASNWTRIIVESTGKYGLSCNRYTVEDLWWSRKNLTSILVTHGNNTWPSTA